MPHSSLSEFGRAMPQNRGVSTPPKQSKAERRAAQLETFRKREAAARRNRIVVIALSILAVLAVVTVVAVVIVVNTQSKVVPQGVQTWNDLERTHVNGSVDYAMDPPAGGPHNPAWLNCGVYTEPQVNEHAVHSLEHGAIWVTYDPAVSSADLAIVEARLPSTYALMSPYPGLDAPFAVSAWGAQLKFSDPDDPAFDDFVLRYWRAADSPEPTAPCSGAVDGPGKK